MRAVILCVVLTFTSQASFAKNPAPDLKGLKARLHTKKEFNNDIFMRMIVGAVQTAKSPKDFYATYVVPSLKNDKKSLKAARKILGQMKRLPRVKSGANWVEFSDKEEKLRLEIIDAAKLQFKIDGHAWTYDRSAPLWLQIEVLQRKFKKKSALHWPDIFIEEAHAVGWFAAVIPPAVAIIVNALANVITNEDSSREGAEAFSASTVAKELGSNEQTALKCFATRSWDSPEFETCRTGGRFEGYKKAANAMGIKSVTRHCLTKDFPVTELLIEYEDSKQKVDSLYVLIYYPADSSDETVLPTAMDIIQIKDGKLAEEGKLSVLFDQETSKARKTPIIDTIDQIKHKNDVTLDALKVKTRDKNSYYAHLRALKYQLESTTVSNASIERKLLYHKRYSKFSSEASAKIKRLHDQILDQVTTFTQFCRTKEDFEFLTPTSLPEIQQKAEETKMDQEAKTTN